MNLRICSIKKLQEKQLYKDMIRKFFAFLSIVIILFVLPGCETLKHDSMYTIFNDNYKVETFYSVEYDEDGDIVKEHLFNLEFSNFSKTIAADKKAVSVGIKALIDWEYKYSITSYRLKPGEQIGICIGDEWEN